MIYLLVAKPSVHFYFSLAMLTDGLNSYIYFFTLGYILPDGKGDVVGTPWEMKIRDDMVIREKSGYIYGYDSIVSILPEMKVGKDP